VLGLLASGRVSALAAGLTGLCLTLITVVTWAQMPWPSLTHHATIGLWMSWLVVSIIATGMFFHRCTLTREPPAQSDFPSQTLTPRRLWSVCFLLAPFAESVTGFGVGYIIAVAALRRLGLNGLPCLLLGLFSQSLVPWGALAVGTTVGAALAAVPAAEMGLRTAVLQGPIHLLYLVAYWRLAAQAGVTVSLSDKVDDLLWTVALIVGVCLTNALADVEIAAAAPTAALLTLRYLRDERPRLSAVGDMLVRQSPYVMLTLALCATRLIPSLGQWLKPIGLMKPFEGQPGFSPLYAPAFWLAAIGVIVLAQTGAGPKKVLIDTLKGGWRACLVTIAFVVMAQLYVGSGMAQFIAAAMQETAGRAAVASVPLFAAVAGFLTGSGAASNAMLMPMLIALASALSLDGAWLAAIQNSVCANLSMLSPMRVSMGAAVLGLAGSEGLLYRRAWPLALPSLIVGLMAVLYLSLSA